MLNSTQTDALMRNIFDQLCGQIAANGCGAKFIGLTLGSDGLWRVDYVDPSAGCCECYANSIGEVPAAVQTNVLRNAARRAAEIEQRPPTVPAPYGFSRTVKKRDGKCLKCGSTENLHAHHIKPKSTHPHLRKDPANGITLCKQCHGEIKGRELESADGLTRLLGASI